MFLRVFCSHGDLYYSRVLIIPHKIKVYLYYPDKTDKVMPCTNITSLQELSAVVIEASLFDMFLQNSRRETNVKDIVFYRGLKS